MTLDQLQTICWICNKYHAWYYGIFDPAIHLDLKEKRRFRTIVGVLGVGEGCYLGLPVLCPTTIRDTVGSLIAMNGGDVWHNITVRDDEEYVKESKNLSLGF